MITTIQTRTPGEIALKYGLSLKTIYRAVQAGDLPCLRINRRVFRITDVDAALWYLAKGMSTTSTTPNGENTDPSLI
ncbi:MAG: DNA-binding protein [Verrucomicrobiaceae bacterium]|nr:MAG: DNA-binding protein [Verrucomicrobiaceae bacterium]